MKSFKRIKKLCEVVFDLIKSEKLSGVTVVDVGADHGYLAEIVSRNNCVEKVIATEISQKCLDKVIDLKNQFQLTKIEPVLCDGISQVDGADIVVMAGIGGYEIIKILNYQNITKNGENKSRFFIIQPSDNVVELKRWLISKKIGIRKDFVVESYRKFYPILVIDVLDSQNYENNLYNLYIGRDNLTDSKVTKKYLKYMLENLKFLDTIDSEKIDKNENLFEKFELKKIINDVLSKD